MNRIVSTTILAAIIVGVAACSESSPTDPDTSVDAPSGIVVSNALQSGSASTVAYLSAIPATLPGAISVSVTNRTKPASAKTAVILNGGFDPIGIAAQSGDELSLVVSLAAGEKTVLHVAVPPRRPPAIVRTGKVEVQRHDGIRSHVVVVFSEPVELSSVTPSSLILTEAGIPVKGSVAVSADRLTAQFIPANDLDRQTYALTVDAGIRDVDGEVLGETPIVTLSGLATAGAIEVSVSTSGPDQDIDGYFLSAQAPGRNQSGRLAATSTQTLEGTQAGNVSIVLYGLAANCTLTGANPRIVKVEAGMTTKVSYIVNCVASGSLRVTTVTTGVDPDTDGYSMSERDRSRIAGDVSHSFTAGLDIGFPSNGTVTASALVPGSYVVEIGDISPNCKPVMPAVQTITIVAGVESSLLLDVTCVKPAQIAFVRGAGQNDNDVTNKDIYVVNSNGTGTVRLTSEPGADIDPAWSPDGSNIAFTSDRVGNRDIYVMNADGSNRIRLTDHASADYQPAYSPDGKRIAFVSHRGGGAEIYLMNSDGTNPVRLTNNAVDDTGPAWSPDGSRIAFSRTGNIYLMSSAGGGETQLAFTAVNTQPAWSPDGGTIAFRSAGRDTYPAVYLMNSDGSQVRRVLGVGYFPSSPDWSPDGALIAFDDWDCWDYGPCPRGIIIGTFDGLYSSGIGDAAQPAWRPQ